MKTRTDEARQVLESAIQLYLETLGESNMVITAWVATIALASPHDDDGRYLQIRTPGMPYHSALGLLYKGIELARR